MKRISQSAWFPFGLGSADAPTRLFCLPYAGGGASTFLSWNKSLPTSLGLAPMQLPGRETRLGEPIPGSLPELVEDLADALTPFLDRPYSLFGYSMGAKLSFSLIHRLAELGLPLPQALGVAANLAPDSAPHRPGVDRLPDPEFAAYLRQLGGTPEQVLSDPDLSRLLFPILRADFRVLEHSAPQGAISCPIFAYAGMEDLVAPPAAMQAWRRFTDGAFTLRVFPGGHFFYQTAALDFLPALGRDLRGQERIYASPAQTALA